MNVIVFAITTNQTLWWITLGAALGVALLVWLLLELLRRTVADVDRAVNQVWTAGKQLAQNTQTTHLLNTTKARGGELVEELGRHRAGGGGG